MEYINIDERKEPVEMVWKRRRREKRERKKEKQKEGRTERERKSAIFSLLWNYEQYMAWSHFSLMYSDANENERLWVKVEQSLQTCNSAVNKSPQLRGKTFLLQRHSKVCTRKSYTVWATFYCSSFLRILGLISGFLSFNVLLVQKSLWCESIFLCVHTGRVWQRFPGRYLSHQSSRGLEWISPTHHAVAR